MQWVVGFFFVLFGLFRYDFVDRHGHCLLYFVLYLIWCSISQFALGRSIYIYTGMYIYPCTKA